MSTDIKKQKPNYRLMLDDDYYLNKAFNGFDPIMEFLSNSHENNIDLPSYHLTAITRILQVMERYNLFIQHQGLKLDEDERHIFINSLNGLLLSRNTIPCMYQEVQDSDFMESGDPAAKTLVSKLKSASDIDILASIEKEGF